MDIRGEKVSAKFVAASDYCHKTGEQNCHACENAYCGDNMTPSIAQLRVQIKRAEAKLAMLEKVVAEALITIGEKEIPLKEMVDAVRVGKTMGGEDEVPFPLGGLTWVADVCKAFGKAHRACNGNGGKTYFSKPKKED
jgi:hypothetical protein